jgi:hypothetical protein
LKVERFVQALNGSAGLGCTGNTGVPITAPPLQLLPSPLLLLLQMATTLSEILSANGGTGNVNLYMAAGGTSEWLQDT